jgi:transcriptional regulator with XRE-family HTH domain
MCEKQIYNAKYRATISALRDIRKKLGLTQAQVAIRLGVGRTWISKIELGELRLDLLHLTILCRVYRVDIHDVIRHME